MAILALTWLAPRCSHSVEPVRFDGKGVEFLDGMPVRIVCTRPKRDPDAASLPASQLHPETSSGVSPKLRAVHLVVTPGDAPSYDSVVSEHAVQSVL